jgi:subtilisin family serine protease
MAEVSVRYGGKNGTAFGLETNDDLVVVRTHQRMLVARAPLSRTARLVLDGLAPLASLPDAGVEVFEVRSGSVEDRDRARAVLGAQRTVRFAGRVLTDKRPPRAPSRRRKRPVLYTENFFVKFLDGVRDAAAEKLLARYRLTIKRRVGYVTNGYFVGAPEGTGLAVFEMAERLLGERSVEYCHPELIRERRRRRAFPQQWHLRTISIGGVPIDASANVVAAWKHSMGKGVTIAVIDDGVDVDHEEFQSKGKIVAPRDVTRRTNDPRPGFRDDHGTACAGVACGDGSKGASGVAPRARLIPIRCASALGAQADADAFEWAVDHGADVISCSWGPDDGVWWDPTDLAHKTRHRLPDSTRLAIEYAVTAGRKGKGCVICWAAGNGNESADLDGYSRNPNVVAVAACNDRGTRSVYSDYGKCVWCCFPSDDYEDEEVGHPAPLTPGIWTTDRRGKTGYNRGGSDAAGDAKGNYANNFGGTSSAAPGVAGVCALILAANPTLMWKDVRRVVKESCTRIDTKKGKYRKGRSEWYGFGRVDAARAVEIARGTVRKVGRSRRR